MALKLLHGPIACTLDPEDSVLSGKAQYSYGGKAIWHDDFGFLSEVTSVTTGMGLSGCQAGNLDGVVYARNYQGSALTRYSLTHDLINNRVLYFNTYGSGYVRVFDPLAGTPYSSSYESFSIDGGPIATRTTTGWWSISTSQLSRSDLDADSFSNVYNYGSGGAGVHISPGRRGGTFYCYLDDAAGTMMEYDYIRQEEVYPNTTNTNRLTLGSNAEMCFYSPKFDIFIALRPNGGDAEITDIYVYGNELVPNALSAPTADPTLTQGNVSIISTTLTDDNGVGIPNRRIDWTLTAGNGDIIDPQSDTDEDGIAITKYRAPIAGGVDPTIQCELTY